LEKSTKKNLLATMGECAAWHRPCGEAPDWQYCTESEDDEPVMLMFFHTRDNVYALFESWVPDSSGAFAGTWFAIFFAAIALELWRALRSYFEFATAAGKPAGSTLSAFVAAHPFRFVADFVRQKKKKKTKNEITTIIIGHDGKKKKKKKHVVEEIA
jgi:Ctr copper transporter family